MSIINVRIGCDFLKSGKPFSPPFKRVILEKTFTFNLPTVPVKSIIIHDDIIDSIPYDVGSYDPKFDTYYIIFRLFYYSDNDVLFYNNEIKKSKLAGWKVTEL